MYSILLLAFFAAIEALAAQEPSVAPTDFSLWKVKAEAGILYRDYSEKLVTPGIKSNEKGWIPGINFVGEFELGAEAHREWLQGAYDFFYGTTNYDGTTQQGAQLPLMKTYNTIWDAEASYHRNILKNLPQLSAYVGIGYHSWVRRVGSRDASSEDYSWFYTPIGMQWQFHFSEALSAILDFSIRPMIYGKIRVYPNGGQKVDLELGRLPTYRAEFPLEYKLNAQTSLCFDPWFEYNQIGQSRSHFRKISSTETEIFYEPASRAYQEGILIGAKFML